MNKKRLWKTIFWGNWLFVAYFWWQGSGNLLTAGLPSIMIALGRLAGLAAAYMILLQFFLMGRTPWLERVYGLDKLSLMHRQNGKMGLLALIFHPLLLILGYKSLAGISFWAQTTSFLFDYEHVLWAAIGFLLFIAVVITSLVIIRSKMRYESWYYVHLLTYLAVFLSFFHQIHVGTDIKLSKTFYWYWLGLYIVVFAHHLAFRFLRPVYNYFRHGFRVEKLVRENYNTISVYITGRGLDQFNIYPGQFMILRFFAKNLWWQAHPFSLSFLPDGRRLRVTIKELGDFTRQIATIKPGTKLMIDGPYGVFTEFFSVSPKVLMIAGGIGITPIRSLIEAMAKHKKDLVLLYSNKTEKDIVFRDELSRIATNAGAKITHVITDDQNYPGEKGILNKQKIRELVPDITNREVYLCGPPPMMESLIRALKDLGLSESQLHYEKFSLG